MDETRKLATFCAGFKFEDLPDDVIHKTKLCLLDYVANVYGSLALDAVSSVASTIRSMGEIQNVTAVGCGFKTSIHLATYLNGITAEAIEAQDGLRFGGNHACSAVIPAALAVGESRGLGGKEIIAAIVAGYETANRISASVHPWHTLSGFMPTGTCGTFGAAAAAGRLMGFNAKKMLHALGNAGYVAPLSMAEQLMVGSTIKIVQGGQAASSGIMAALLSGAGITGDEHVLEGSDLKGGFTQITSRGEPKPELITDGLGEHFTMLDVYFKPYTACRHTHGAAQAVIHLIREKIMPVDSIAAVDVYTYNMAVVAVGKGRTSGDSFVTAQFSIPHVVAVCLMDHEMGPAQLTEKRIADPALIELSQKVTVKPDEKLNAAYPDKTSSRVEITLKNGEKRICQVDIPKGDPRDPMNMDDIHRKVGRFAGTRDAKQIDGLREIIQDLDRMKDIRQFIEAI
ncbi:MAG: MmgE/PrpD family protein [Syntrophales bacterium]|jgi:2-methylcitrate dehydratase PrpD